MKIQRRFGPATLAFFLSTTAALAQSQPPVLGERPGLPNAIDPVGPPSFEQAQPKQQPAPQRARSGKKGKSRNEAPEPIVAKEAPPEIAWSMHAGVTAGVLFDDNIYARNSNREGDRVAILRPEIGVVAKGSNFQSVLQASFERQTYERFTVENQSNWAGSIGTIYMPRNDIQIQSRFALQRAHEQRGSAESILQQFDKPVAYDQYSAALSVNKRFDGWWTSVGGARTWIDYQDPTIQGTPVDQSYRDGQISVGTGRLGIVVAPRTSLFLDVTGNRRDFKVDNYDSNGFRLAGGMLFEPGEGSRLRGEALFGYMEQDYAGATFQNFQTWTYGGALAYLFDQNLKMTLAGSREAKESALNGGVSVLESTGTIRFDYLLMPGLVIGAGVSYLHQYYSLAERQDDTWGPLAALKYTINPNFAVGVEYRYVGFSSEAASVAGYYRNAVLFNLTGRI